MGFAAVFGRSHGCLLCSRQAHLSPTDVVWIDESPVSNIDPTLGWGKVTMLDWHSCSGGMY